MSSIQYLIILYGVIRKASVIILHIYILYDFLSISEEKKRNLKKKKREILRGAAYTILYSVVGLSRYT